MWCLPGLSTLTLLFKLVNHIIGSNIFRFSTNFDTLVLACIDASCVQQLLLWWVPNDDFLFLHNSSTFLFEILQWELSCLSSVIYLLKYLYQDGLRDISLILWVIFHHSHYLFCCSHCPKFDQWKLFKIGFSVLLTYPQQFLSTFLLSGNIRRSRFTLYFF